MSGHMLVIPSTGDIEAGGLQVQVQPEQLSETSGYLSSRVVLGSTPSMEIKPIRFELRSLQCFQEDTRCLTLFVFEVWMKLSPKTPLRWTPDCSSRIFKTLIPQNPFTAFGGTYKEEIT